jgi:hypothetical protein
VSIILRSHVGCFALGCFFVHIVLTFCFEYTHESDKRDFKCMRNSGKRMIYSSVKLTQINLLIVSQCMCR